MQNDCAVLEPLIAGDEKSVRAFLRKLPHDHYVYALAYADLRPFYIGKGVNFRVFEHVLEARRNHRISETNPHKCNKIRKLENQGEQILFCILSSHPTGVEAEREESNLITRFGRACEGGPLTNLAPGRESDLGIHPESKEKHAATLSYDPNNPARDPETHALNEFMASVLEVKSNPLKPRSKYKGRRVEHTTGTTRSKTPKQRSAAALAIAASLNGVRLIEGEILPRCFVYRGIPAILENGVSNDIIGTGIADVQPSDDPADEHFQITGRGANVIVELLGRECLETLSLL